MGPVDQYGGYALKQPSLGTRVALEPGTIPEDIRDDVLEIEKAYRLYLSSTATIPQLAGIKQFLKTFEGSPYYPLSNSAAAGFAIVRTLIGEYDNEYPAAPSVQETLLSSHIAGILRRWMSPEPVTEAVRSESLDLPAHDTKLDISLEITVLDAAGGVDVLVPADTDAEPGSNVYRADGVEGLDARAVSTVALKKLPFIPQNMHPLHSMCLYCKREQIAAAGSLVGVEFVMQRIEQALAENRQYQQYGVNNYRKKWRHQKETILLEMERQIEQITSEGLRLCPEIENVKDCSKALRLAYRHRTTKTAETGIFSTIGRVFRRPSQE